MMCYLCRVVVIIMLVVLYDQHIMQAQSPDSLFVTIQDSLRVCRIMGGDTVPASLISSGYAYEMSYPPYSSTRYVVTECKRNGGLLKLAAWKDGRRVHAPAELLTFNSRTEYFPVADGDTVSFYRSLEWINPSNRRQDTNNYYSLDTLDMVVHLVRVSDGMPIQLDSLSVLPQVPVGVPTIYGERPIMALVHYIVPSVFDGDSAFIGITVRARGQGAYHWVRHDVVTAGESARLTRAYFVTYLDLFDKLRQSGSFERRSVNELTAAMAAKPEQVLVTPIGSRTVRLSVVNASSTITSNRLAVFDGAGQLLARQSDGNDFIFTAPAAGMYYVAIIAGDEILTATRVTIQE